MSGWCPLPAISVWLVWCQSGVLYRRYQLDWCGVKVVSSTGDIRLICVVSEWCPLPAILVWLVLCQSSVLYRRYPFDCCGLRVVSSSGDIRLTGGVSTWCPLPAISVCLVLCQSGVLYRRYPFDQCGVSVVSSTGDIRLTGVVSEWCPLPAICVWLVLCQRGVLYRRYPFVCCGVRVVSSTGDIRLTGVVSEWCPLPAIAVDWCGVSGVLYRRVPYFIILLTPWHDVLLECVMHIFSSTSPVLAYVIQLFPAEHCLSDISIEVTSPGVFSVCQYFSHLGIIWYCAENCRNTTSRQTMKGRHIRTLLDAVAYPEGFLVARNPPPGHDIFNLPRSILINMHCQWYYSFWTWVV